MERKSLVMCKEEEFLEKEEEGYPLEEVIYRSDKRVSEISGVDQFKITRMLRSGELTLNDLTDELLNSPKFKYEPYPGFKPIPCPAPDWSGVSPEERIAFEAVMADEFDE
jgi:hypothetical protein